MVLDEEADAEPYIRARAEQAADKERKAAKNAAKWGQWNALHPPADGAP